MFSQGHSTQFLKLLSQSLHLQPKQDFNKKPNNPKKERTQQKEMITADINNIKGNKIAFINPSALFD